jgi:hypothetical protein
MDSASDFGSGGWGFESPLGLFFCFLVLLFSVFLDIDPPSQLRRCNFGRVVKALALGASLERGMGSNPIGCKTHFLSAVRGCSSLGRAVGSQSAGTGIETLLLHTLLLVRQWCIGNIEASQALAPGSTPGWRIGTFFHVLCV